MARDVQDRQLRPLPLQFPGELRASHPGQHHIGDEELHRRPEVLTGGGERLGLLGARNVGHRVARVLERASDERTSSSSSTMRIDSEPRPGVAVVAPAAGGSAAGRIATKTVAPGALAREAEPPDCTTMPWKAARASPATSSAKGSNQRSTT